MCYKSQIKETFEKVIVNFQKFPGRNKLFKR